MKLGHIHWKQFEKFLFTVGCTFVSQEGDHRKYHKKGLARPVIIPRVRSIPVFIILNNLRTLGVSREQYLEMLKSL